MKLAFRISGSPESPPLLLLHGFLGSAADWQNLVYELNQSFYLIQIDLPSHGHSQSLRFNDACTPVETVNRLINDVLDQLGLQQVGILGYSMGGRIAMGYALSWPENVSQLIIESADPGLLDEKAKKARWYSDQQWAERFSSQPLDDVLEDWYQQPVFVDLTNTERKLLVIERQNQSGKALSDALISFSVAKQPNYSQGLITAPFSTHYIFGELDNKYISIGEMLEQTGVVASCHRIEGAGHNVHRMQPEKMAAVIKALSGVNGVDDE